MLYKRIVAGTLWLRDLTFVRQICYFYANAAFPLHLTEFMRLLLRFLIAFALLAGELWAQRTSAPTTVEVGDGVVCAHGGRSWSISSKSDERGHCEGVLSDSFSLLRLVSSLNQRTFGSGNGSSQGVQGRHSVATLRKRGQQQLFHIHYTKVNREEAAPFDISASCHYYVFALRRILC